MPSTQHIAFYRLELILTAFNRSTENLQKYFGKFIFNMNFLRFKEKKKRLWKIQDEKMAQFGDCPMLGEMLGKIIKTCEKSCQKNYEHGFNGYENL